MELAWQKIEFNNEQIEQLRSRIYEYALQHPNEIMIEDLRSRITPPGEVGPSMAIKDWMLKRYLAYAKPKLNVEAATKNLIEFFKFRHQQKVYNLTFANSFPIEFYQLQMFSDHCYDRHGNKVAILRSKFYRSWPLLDAFVKRGLLCYTEHYDRLFEEGKFPGLVLLFDVTDFDYIRHTNIDSINFILSLQQYYPGVLKQCIAYNLPTPLYWIIRMFQLVANRLFPSRHHMIVSIRDNELDDYIDREQRPQCLNGLLTDKPFPDGVVPFEEFLEKLRSQNDAIIEKFEENEIKRCRQLIQDHFNVLHDNQFAKLIFIID